MASDLKLPKFIAFGFNPNGHYLSYVRDGGDIDGYLKLVDTCVQSPFAKFQVEAASADGLFHIRSCQNNKYWERTKNISITGNPAEEYWITATANSKEEDQSKASCTLFKFFSVDPATNSVRIAHVQSGCYLCQWALASPTYGGCVLANYQIYDHQGCDIFQLIDWSSLVILPRFVAFKGDNDRYLSLCYLDGGQPYLQFAATDIADSTVPCEIFVANDGTVRIKTTCIDKFWRRSTNNWIWADSDDTSIGDKDTLYRGVQVDDKTIGLINLGNDYFCKRLTAPPQEKTNCLNAALPTVTTEGRITVEEPVLRREIYDVKYDLDDSRVYDQKSLILATNSVVNSSPEPTTLDVKLSYVDTTARTWSTNFSLKLDMKSTVDLSVPLIYGGKVEISDEVQSGVVWGDTYTSTKVVEVVHNVVVPAMTKVTVNLVASKGTCDVPFTFTQRDTLYDGTIVQAEINGSYTGSNYYNIIETKEESVE
ncbi:hypothetical protein V6N13_008990 [Hibiscus sabdariffa]|uniref:Agglutinin domain-containing protein n=1 Tax=Hibiscus sabdariffa TaxID=183260 RepID=A0ABR2NR49_9ROSI